MHNTRSRATDKHEIVQSSSATSYYFFLLLFSVFLYIVISFAAGWLVEFFDNVVVASRTHSPIYSILSVAENACQNALYMQWPAKPGCTRRASTNSESGLFFAAHFFFMLFSSYLSASYFYSSGKDAKNLMMMYICMYIRRHSPTVLFKTGGYKSVCVWCCAQHTNAR